ncbi:MAG TPA: carbamoyltransferase C-terminal domain-containing protein [Polyangia bacterium]|nr:carbamoyltransferase C-terminal domain-containing protein [Polyangia bacterium]
MSVILGVNAYHGDSAACIVVNGTLVAAAEEERFRRIKHWAGFPSEAIRYCLHEARARLSDVRVIAINSDPKAGRLERIAYLIRRRPDLAYVLHQLKTRRQRKSIETTLAEAFPGERFGGTIQRVEHHRAHLASAYYLSPWDEAVAVSIDGFGDFASAAWGLARGNRIDVEHRVHFPHSLGIFYETMTQYLGFPNYGDEYKVMGLAPYGKPTYVDQLAQVVKALPDGSFELDLKYFRHVTEAVTFSWSGGEPMKNGLMYTPALEQLLGPARQPKAPLEDMHRDLARSIQVTYERVFFNLLHAVHRKHRVDNLALAGGCGFNSVANGKITLQTPFKRVYVQSAAGDAGGAVGAALHAHHERSAETKHPYVKHAYLGPSYTNEEIGALLDKEATKISEQRCTVERVESLPALYQRTAKAIAAGRVVGWFQGRMEWGPRALGNRSILGDPRRADMKDILNLKIKRRESFRPFAPSILRDDVAEWFELDDEVPFMMKVFQIREDKRAQIPAVTHVDGSGRLQTVYRDTNERYHDLISAFRDLTGVPMVLNTSFNENEPVVCKPAEALDCFLRTKMDLLVLGDWAVERNEALET